MPDRPLNHDARLQNHVERDREFAQVRQVFEDAPEVLIISTRAGEILRVNRQAATLRVLRSTGLETIWKARRFSGEA